MTTNDIKILIVIYLTIDQFNVKYQIGLTSANSKVLIFLEIFLSN